MKLLWIAEIFIVFLATTVVAQDYARAANLNRRRNRNPLLVAVLGAVVGGVVGATVQGQRLTRKFKKEKLDLLEQVELTLQQRDEKWRKEYMRVYKAYEELEKETVERDYEEFKAPDTNNDDMISRAEFNAYVTKYLSSFPELSEADFPKFDDFDQDEDGLVSFDEWQKFLVQQKLQEAQMKKNDKNNNSAYQELLSSLYEQSNQADSWDSLTKNTPKNGRARRIA